MFYYIKHKTQHKNKYFTIFHLLIYTHHTKSKSKHIHRGAEKAQFEKLLASEGLYRVRVKPAVTSPNESVEWIMASIPTCELVKSGFKEEMKFTFDQGNIIDGSSIASINSLEYKLHGAHKLQLLSLDYRVQTSRFTKNKNCHKVIQATDTEIRFSSAASFTTATPAQVPAFYVDNVHMTLS